MGCTSTKLAVRDTPAAGESIWEARESQQTADLPAPVSPPIKLRISRATQKKREAGVTLKDVDGQIIITAIHTNGLVHEWNVTHPEEKVQAGDIVLTANGIQATANTFWDVAADLWKSASIEMEVQRSPKQVKRRKAENMEFMEDHMSNKKCSVPMQFLRTVNSEDVEDGIECAICCGSVDEETQVLQLGCRHVFHTQCIAHWLVRGRETCPVCRQDVVSGCNDSK
jgi:hypothetical protein